MCQARRATDLELSRVEISLMPSDLSPSSFVHLNSNSWWLANAESVLKSLPLRSWPKPNFFNRD